MRAVPVHGASEPPRASRTEVSLGGGMRVPRAAFPLCIAGEHLQIAESTDEKLSGILSGPPRTEARSTSDLR